MKVYAAHRRLFRWPFFQRFAAMPAKTVRFIKRPAAVRAQSRRSAGLFTAAFDHPRQTAHLRQEQIPQSQNQRDARNNQQRIGDDRLRQRDLADGKRPPDGNAIEKPARQRRTRGDQKHQVTDSAESAALADQSFRQADVMRMYLTGAGCQDHAPGRRSDPRRRRAEGFIPIQSCPAVCW